MKQAVKRPTGEKESITDKIDRIVTNKFLGLPIFLLIIFLIFYLTYTVGAPFQDLIDEGWTILSGYILEYLGEGMVSSLLVDGVIGGVGGILTFLPIIFILFFLLSLIEDIGYLARAAFVIDRVMYKLMGLSGKAFIPMILGIGCGVTGIMSTRTLSNESDRISTMMAIPFISCSARAPIYALFTAAFFDNPLTQAIITFGLYVFGMIIAIIVAKVLKSSVFADEATPFIMELPPYRIPTLKSAVLHMWERGFLFIKKAGTIILGTSVLVWILANLPPGVEYGSVNSFVGILGNIFAPVFAPLGFGFWQAGVALIFGIMAKEIVVSTFGTLFSLEEDDEEGITGVVGDMFTPLSAISFMVFTLLYVPCFAALGAIKEESNSWKWMLISVVLCCGIAYVTSLIIYQGGLLLGFT